MINELAHVARRSRVTAARNDLMTGAIIVAAAIMLVGTGSSVMTTVLRAVNGVGDGVSNSMAIAVLLNIALVLFGWRRYRDLQHEVDEHAQAEERAQILALKDPLTGFFNRRALNEQGGALLARARRQHRPVAILMLDLDHFKHVNDSHGHAVGDLLLTAVAAVIEAAIAARLGGDEFACAFIYDPADAGVVDRTAAALVDRLSQPFDADGKHVHISSSIGIASSAADCDTVEALMRRADIAMYAAKQQGRNRAAWFDMSMEHQLQARSAVETGLRNGIPKGEFVPYFEKQIDLTTGRIHGFEVLARWDHPLGGVVEPDEFITVAEEIGLIGELSLSVMRQALVEARSWDPSLTIAVNISPTQLKDPWLAQKLVKLLTETGFPAQRLEVEITETSLFENLALAQSTVGSLKNQGIRLALDDFGTGYSSLAHLRALPFDRIKIDKSFVGSIIDNAESAAIVNAITRLGDSLGLPVTAEGIEHIAIEERLRQLGCHKGQGWLYGRPLPIAAARRFLAERGLLPERRSSASAAPVVRPPASDDSVAESVVRRAG